MELKNLLEDIKNVGSSGMAKTASHETGKTGSEKSGSAKAELLQTLQSAMQPEQQKTAAKTEQPVTEKLAKIAQDLANSDAEALVKEAHVYGAAVADGFMARLGQYEEAAAHVPQAKTASPAPKSEEEAFEKFASENPEIVKEAAELGYLRGMQEIEALQKQAALKGYQDTMAQVNGLIQTKEGQEKLASAVEQINENLSGANNVESTLRKIASEPDGKAKLAAVQKGYQDTMQEVEKIASDCFSKGYENTINILRAL